jgi:hypothetical protein
MGEISMLRIPSFSKIGNDVTAYQDDAVWTRFYLVPSIPTIRRDQNGRPVFLLTIIHTSDDTRAATPDMPRGGGFMNFDVQFAVDEASTEAARRELQQWVTDEYARRRADPRYSSLPEYAGADAPGVELADPLLSGGTVTMHTTQSALLVTGRFAEAPASLVAGSTAIFNMDLTETGAGFMKHLFMDSAGEGRVDLTPVQVGYHLKMWARLPPVAITVKGNSERIHQTLEKISQTNRDNICTPLEIETFRENGTNSSTLRETGLVEVHIDQGDATLPHDVVEGLQQYALDLFDTMIEERFLVAATAGEGLTFDEDLQPSAPRGNRPASQYKLRESLNTATMNLEIKIDRSQVVEWPTGGSATLATFFQGATAAELKRHVVELTADDFNTLGVTVRAHVDFDKSPVQAVEVQTEYTATDANGQRHTTPGAFTFRSGETNAGKFDPTIIKGQREYRYRYRVIYDDGAMSEFTPWETATSRAVNVAVGNPGKLDLEVSAASLNWDVVRTVRVDLKYSDPLDGAAALEQGFELTKLNPVKKWERQFNRAIRGSVTAKTTYILADEKVIEGSTETVPATTTLFMVRPPQVDVLNVSFVPAGNWSDVAQVVVSVEYDAGQGRIYDKTIRFKTMEEFVEWTVLLRDPTRRTYRYKTLATFKTHPHPEQSDWVSETGDKAIPLMVVGPPRLRVNVLSTLVDFARTPATAVSLNYDGQTKTLSFTAAGASVWDVPVAANGSREYAYTITWFPADGQPVSSGPHRTADTELFVPRAQLPSVGKLDVVLRGFAVDFTATPFVDVALVWRDGALEERKTITLSNTEKNATWSVPIGDRTQRRYQYAITYNLADGTRVPGQQGETSDPVLSITRYQP